MNKLLKITLLSAALITLALKISSKIEAKDDVGDCTCVDLKFGRHKSFKATKKDCTAHCEALTNTYANWKSK